MLAVDLQRLPARDEHRGAAGRVEPVLDQLRDRVEDLLAVVQDEQHPPRPHDRGQRVAGLVAELGGQPERRRDRGDDVVGVGRGDEVDEVRPAVERRCGGAGDLDRQPRLPAAGGADERDQRRRRHQTGEFGQLVGPADDRGHPVREPDLRPFERVGLRRTRRRDRPRRAGQCRVLAQDAGLHVAQLGAGLDAELVVEQSADLPVRRERLVGAAQPVLREHPQRPQPFAHRVVGDGRLQLQQRPVRCAPGQQRLDQQFPDLAALLLQARDRGGRPLLLGQRGEGTAPPQAERLVGAVAGVGGAAVGEQGPGLVGQPGEPQRVDRGRVDGEPVAAGLVQQHLRRRPTATVGFERLAQPPHVRVQRRRRARDVAPHRRHQRRRPHVPSRLDQQQRQGGRQPSTAERDRRTRAFDLQRAEVAEPQTPRRRCDAPHHRPPDHPTTSESGNRPLAHRRSGVTHRHGRTAARHRASGGTPLARSLERDWRRRCERPGRHRNARKDHPR